jgi:hypothetical protein
MGGGNAQKSAAAREKNLKAKGPTPEALAASKAKAAKDRDGHKCSICLQTFMIATVRRPRLFWPRARRRPR